MPRAVKTLALALEAQEVQTQSRIVTSALSISSVLLELEIHLTTLALLVASAHWDLVLLSHVLQESTVPERELLQQSLSVL